MNTAEPKRTQNVFLVLLALSNGAKHGYEISKYLETKSSGVFRVPFGSLYPVLHKLEQEKMIVARWDGMDTQKPRKVYSLTPRGTKALEDELQRHRANNSAIDRLT